MSLEPDLFGDKSTRPKSILGNRWLLLSEAHVDHLTQHYLAYLLGGFAIMMLVYSVPRDWKIGFFSGFMLFSVGTVASRFRKWRTEPGIWMLSLLLASLYTPIWAYFEYFHWQWVFEPPPPNQAPRAVSWDELRLSIDATIACFIFGELARLCATVAIGNWQQTGRRAKPAM